MTGTIWRIFAKNALSDPVPDSALSKYLVLNWN
jgi:hypothetical protein